MLNIDTPMHLLIVAISFISAFAAITASIIMAKFLKKFVTGILARGFKTIGIGIFILALGIIMDATEVYLQILNNSNFSALLLILKPILFLLGTYIIVIGSKTMGDKLETLSKQTSA